MSNQELKQDIENFDNVNKKIIENRTNLDIVFDCLYELKKITIKYNTFDSFLEFLTEAKKLDSFDQCAIIVNHVLSDVDNIERLHKLDERLTKDKLW